MKHIAVFFCLALLLAGCSSGPAPIAAETAAQTEAPTAATVPETQPQPTLPPEEAMLSRMTLRQKVGQLFLVRPDALDLKLSLAQIDDPNTPGVVSVTQDFLSTLEQYPVGGFVQFAKNIESPDQLLAFNEALSQASPIPPFLSVDEEGGLVARLANHPGFDLPRYRSAGAVGAEGDPMA